MSTYSLNQIKKFARDSIKNIIPLDDKSIDEMVQYAIKNFKTRESISNHFLDILGPSNSTFEFISDFGDILFGPNKENLIKESNNSNLNNEIIKSKPKTVIKIPNKSNKSTGIRLVKNKTVSAVKNDHSSKGRLSNNNKKGVTTAEMFDLKPNTVKVQNIKKKEVQKKLDNIQDLDDVLLELELLDKNENPKDIKVCNCNATRHPLFEMYPNCLNCGKIICVKEGLQPCSFCGKSLMSNEEKMEIKEILNREKEELESSNEKNKNDNTNSNKTKNKKKNVIKVTLNTPGQNNFKIQEQLYNQIEESRKQEREERKAKKEEQELIDMNRKEIEYYRTIHKKDPELIKAEERLAMLLNFQDNGAERTKIIDNAADFELPTGGGNLWASPLERALQLKRQQKQQKRMEDDEKNRGGRGNTVVDMTIKDGKVVFQDRDNEVTGLDNLSDDEEVNELQNKVNKEKLKQFKEESKNIYDYEDFNNKLHKPIYHVTQTEERKIKEESEAMDKIISELPKIGTVVQPGDAEDQENQLFTMIGV